MFEHNRRSGPLLCLLLLTALPLAAQIAQPTDPSAATPAPAAPTLQPQPLQPQLDLIPPVASSPTPKPTANPIVTPAPTPPAVIAPSPAPAATPSTAPTFQTADVPAPVPSGPLLIHAYNSNSLVHIPWKDGETLSYHVMWGIVDAADGTFVTKSSPEGNLWTCTLELHSRGAVETIYPFHDKFTTSISKSPWRSLSYTEDRHEPGRVVTDITEVDYPRLSAARLVANKSKDTTESHNFTFSYDALDDLGSMLLHLRAFKWSPGETHMLYVYENNSAKEGIATCQAIETKAFGDWPSQELIKVHAVPGKGTHRHGYLTVWMTNDSRRIPIHADLNFYYGTFSIDLTSFKPGKSR